MTTFAGQSCPARESRPGGAQRLVFGWTISPDVAGALGMMGGVGGLRLEVETPRPFERALLAARLVGGERVRELECSAEARWIRDEATGLVHLEAPGVLNATLRAKREGFDVLYARTPLLAALKIGGGRYEFEGVQLREDC